MADTKERVQDLSWCDWDFDEAEGEEEEEEEEVRPLWLREGLSRLLRPPAPLADVIFLLSHPAGAKTGSTTRVPAHRLLLAAASPLFEAMLYPTYPGVTVGTETTNSPPMEITLVDTDPETFCAMLECIYTDEVFVDADNVESLIQMATKYQIEKIMVECGRFLEQDLTTDTICKIFEIAPRLLGDRSFGLKFIEENIEDVLNSPGFLTLSKSRVAAIFADSKLPVEEGFLFDALTWWGKHQIKERRKEEAELKGESMPPIPITAAEIKDTISDLLPLIRFPLMDVKKIASVIGPSHYLEDGDMLALWRYVCATDEKVKKSIKVRFITAERGGSLKMGIVWDGSQGFTHNLYDISNKGRTARKARSDGTIYILRATKSIDIKASTKAYWELHLESIPSSSRDIHIGMAPSHYNFSSAWLSGGSAIYIDRQGRIRQGSQVISTSHVTPLASDDRLGFSYDPKKATFEILRGTGKKGKLTSLAKCQGVLPGSWFPCVAARTVGFVATVL